MKGREIHIVAFDVPYPADYGGVIDIYYKIKALHKCGIKIHLHTFHYGREKSVELEKFCESVNYYKRKNFISSLSLSMPYIVKSRRSNDLIDRLKKDSFPIIFEGLHTCYYLDHPDLADREKVVRMHNIEWKYYSHLSRVENNIFRKLYFRLESKLLFHYERILKHASFIIAINKADQSELREHHDRIYCLAPFHENEELTCKTGIGEYALYHGNLSVSENIVAAKHLGQRVFESNSLPLKVAGSGCSTSLERFLKLRDVSVVKNPSNTEMKKLMSDAHIHTLYTDQATGVKLKLINTLFQGRWIVANPAMIANTPFAELCVVAASVEEMKTAIKRLENLPFPPEEIDKRKSLLFANFSNLDNAKQLIKWLEQNQ